MIIEDISRETGFPPLVVAETVRRASHLYKVYQIPKRGSQGFRTIEHPTPLLKALQRWVALRVVSTFPVHEAVYSYRVGRSILDHASVHRHGHFLLRLDLADFFPSITSDAVAALLATRAPHLSKEDVEIIVRIVCRSHRLTIGAPSSPPISNAVLHPFDEAIALHCQSLTITYSRYADDLYFSTGTGDILESIPDVVREQLSTIPGLTVRLNNSKSIFTSPKRRRLITGLIVTPQSEISIGRSRKRQIKSLIYRFSRGELNVEEISHLKGLVGFATHVEPRFAGALARKFGDATMALLAQAPNAARKPR